MYEAKSISYYTGSIAYRREALRERSPVAIKSPVIKEEKKNHG
jgi:hypothetical protein